MADSISIPTHLIGTLKALRSALHLAEEVLAEGASISRGTVSNFFNGQSLRRENAGVVVAQLRKFLAQHSGDLPGSDRKRFMDALGQAEALINPAMSSTRASPGGAIPPGATNRIERPEETTLLETLADPTDPSGPSGPPFPFTCVLRGSPQCGRSTLLLALQAQAEQRGLLTAFYDCRGAARRNEDAATLLDDLASELEPILGASPAVRPLTIVGFKRWLQAARLRRPSPQMVILMDDLTRLPDGLVLDFFDMARELHNQRERLGLSWVFVLGDSTPQDEDIWHKSTAASFYPRVEVGWFNRQQLANLVAHYDLDPKDDALLRFLEKGLGGQPYLCHMAVVMCSKQPFSEVYDRARLPAEEFAPHVRLVTADLQKQGLTVPVDVTQAKDPLRRMHLLSADGSDWASAFYRRHLGGDDNAMPPLSRSGS